MREEDGTKTEKNFKLLTLNVSQGCTGTDGERRVEGGVSLLNVGHDLPHNIDIHVLRQHADSSIPRDRFCHSLSSDYKV